jgi:hypothetical protein
MKKFKNVQEWVDSKPAKEDLERVMNTINRGVLREIRKEISEKTREIKKMQKMVKAMEEVKFPVEESVLNLITETEQEIESLKKELPQKVE